MKEMIYCIDESESKFCGDLMYVLSYATSRGFYSLGRVSKEKGEEIINTIESYHNYYKLDKHIMNDGSLRRTYYFDIDKKKGHKGGFR